MVTIESLFQDLGGPAAIGRVIGKPAEHVRLMKKRRSIPVAYWPALISAAKKQGQKLTYEALVQAHASKRSAA